MNELISILIKQLKARFTTAAWAKYGFAVCDALAAAYNEGWARAKEDSDA